jgi:hypothetical protein
MRSAIVTLIATAGVATAAIAQTAPATPPAPPTAPVAAPAAPAATPATATPAPMASPATVPAAPPATAPAATPGASAPAVPPAAAPADGTAPPAPEAAPPEKVYAVPTDGEIGQVINVINTICVPVVHDGMAMSKVANAAAGFKANKRDGTYVSTLVAKPYTLTLYEPGSNKNVCRMVLNYTTGQEKPIIVGLNIFSLLHKPELEQQRNDFVPATDFKRITNSWEYFTDHVSIGLVFLQLKKPDGSEISPKWGTGEVLYSERSF